MLKALDQLNRIENTLYVIKTMLKKQGCEPESCSVCIHGQTVVGTDGKFQIVCGKNMKAKCADFTPRRLEDVAAAWKGEPSKVTQEDIQQLRQAMEY